MNPCFHARPRMTALAFGCTLLIPQAQAQTIPTVEITADAPRAGSLLDLDTPLDTASRLGLSARETPATVTVVDRALIDVRGAQDTQEILRAIPGVTAHNAPGNIGVSYRGFGSGSISQLFNGINVQYAIAARPVDSWIIDRVEAIGGPSSFLFGSGAVGGSINYITKLAEARELSQAQVRLGAHGLKEASVGLNRQLSDGQYARIDINHRDTGSPIDGVDSRSTQLAASLLSQFGRGVTHTLAYEFQQEDVDRPVLGHAAGQPDRRPGAHSRGHALQELQQRRRRLRPARALAALDRQVAGQRRAAAHEHPLCCTTRCATTATSRPTASTRPTRP